MKKGLHKSKKVCYENPSWETGVIFGPVAQLGERTVRIRKVVGSNPFRSTKKEETTVGCLFFFGFAAAGGSTRGQFEMLGEMNSPRAKVFCLRQNTCDPPLGAAAGRRHLSCSDIKKEETAVGRLFLFGPRAYKSGLTGPIPLRILFPLSRRLRFQIEC